MTEMATQAPATGPRDAAQARIKRRYAAERRFKWICLGALAIAGIFLVVLLASIVSRGYTAFVTTEIELPITFDPELVDADAPRDGNYRLMVVNALQQELPNVEQSDLRKLLGLVSNGAFRKLQSMVAQDPAVVGTFL